MLIALNISWRASIELGFVLLLLAWFAGCSRESQSQRAGERPGTEPAMTKTQTQAVTVDLRVDAVGNRVQATLDFINRSQEIAFLEKTNACASRKIENDVFEIKSQGTRIPYIGILEKRNPPGPDDFIGIAPGKKFTTAVFLDEAYEFLRGTHVYTARYSALHDYPDKDDYFELQSGEVSFTLSR